MIRQAIRFSFAMCIAAVVAGHAWADGPRIVPDVVYGHKDGMALTFDVIKPAKPNGAGILWIQSGGWYSRWVEPKFWPHRQALSR